MNKKNQNHIMYIVFSSRTAIPIYREVLKKYTKRAITLQKHFFKNLRKPFINISHKECYAKIGKFSVGRRGCNLKDIHPHIHILPNVGNT